MATIPENSLHQDPLPDARFRQMVEHAVIGVLSVDSQGVVTYANPSMARMLGYGVPDLVGRSLEELVFPEDLPRLQHLMERRHQGVSETFDFRFRSRDGGERWSEVSTTPDHDAAGRVIGASAMIADITERRRMEAALQLSEERFKWVAYATSDALYEWTIPAGTISWSMGIQSLTGLPENGPLDIQWWTDHVHPDHQERVTASLQAAIDSGSDFWSEEYPFARADGTYAEVLDRGFFLRDEQGQAQRMIGAMEDRTERKRAEEAELELRAREQAAKTELESYRELDRMKSQFVNAVSHELRTPLTSMMGYAEFLEEGLGGELTDTQRDFVEQIRRGSKRLEHLLDDLLDFGRMEANTFRLVAQEEDLAAKVDEVVESLRPLAREAGVQLDWQRPAEAALVVMDGHRIEQVLVNLIGNALKFTPRGGRVHVSLRRDATGLGIEVSDTGPGIDPVDHAKLFQRFSQLPAGAQRGGTGLGLAISKALVEAHGGSIGVRSTPGSGSVFWFQLPGEA